MCPGALHSAENRPGLSAKPGAALELLRSAAELNGATEIALTFADYLDVENRQARRYDQLQRKTILFIEEIERVTGAPVTLIGTRFDERSVIDRRHP